MFHDDGASTERTGTGELRSASMTTGNGSRMGPENEKPVLQISNQKEFCS